MSAKLTSTLRAVHRARPTAKRFAAGPAARASYAQIQPGTGFTSRDLIPDEPAGPSVRTETVPGPAGKAAVCHSSRDGR